MEDLLGGRGWGRGRPEARGESLLKRRGPNLTNEGHAMLVDQVIKKRIDLILCEEK